MQRLTRYPLLIRQILQYTDPPTPIRESFSTPPPTPPPQLTLSLPSEHAEREWIVNALGCAELILEDVNETIREQESRARLSEVSKELRLGTESVVHFSTHLTPLTLRNLGVWTLHCRRTILGRVNY